MKWEGFSRWARLIAFWLLDRSVLCCVAPRSDTALIIRLDAIGDFVVWLQSGAADIVLELRQRHAVVAIVANEAWSSLAVDLGIFDEVIAVTPKRFMRSASYRWSRLRRIRKLGAKTVIQPRSARVFLQEDEIVRLCGASERIGISGNTINISARLLAYSNSFYTRLESVASSILIHESVKNRAFAAALCTRTGATVDAALLTQHGKRNPAGRYAVLAPGAGWSGRQWPTDKFVQVVEDLYCRHNMPCVIAGSVADAALANHIGLHSEKPLIDFTGQLTLSETVALIAGATLVISNESGPMHIAVWCGTPTVGMLGGGHYGWFAPYPPAFPNADRLFIANHRMPCYGCDWKCIYDVPAGKPVPCVANIATAGVLRQADAALSCGV